jgi:[Skp1-protein]-hydroxyproline N-acetylglucosaminyltransferase
MRLDWALVFLVVLMVGLVISLYVIRDKEDENKTTDPKTAAKEKVLKAEADAKDTLADPCQIDKADDFVPKLKSAVKPGTIFVSIASYRDDECKDTVYDMYEKAANPDKVFTGVVQQNMKEQEDCFDKCAKCKARKDSGHIRVKNFPHTEAKGPTFARFEASKLWDGEQYFLQIDSHTKFEEGWDTTIINEIEATNDPKAIMGGYPPTQKQMEDFKKNGFRKMITMCNGVMNKNGVPELRARVITAPKGDGPVKMMYSGAGMMMMPYQALLDVPYDPYLSYLFFGEEILHSARLWTAGYNFYAPRRSYVVHHYGRSGKPKFWNDKGLAFKSCQGKAVKRTKYLLGQINLDQVPEDYRKDLDKYGMGNKRSLDDYLNKAGIDLKNKKFNSICKEMGTP